VALATFVPAGTATAGALVDALGAALLHAPLPELARAALVEYASDGRGASQSLDTVGLSRKMPDLAGLLLASPAFQVYCLLKAFFF
jgi:hypothetical protein